jgi:thymidylate synthase
MHVIRARNAHDALIMGLIHLQQEGVAAKSRNGDVVRSPCPVTTVYERPRERVVLHSWRDANPFFHLYESLWMLTGRSDVAPLVKYVKRMSEFSDDGIYLNAAYGSRWRSGLKGDQLLEIISRLRADRTTRRCVLQIWDANQDLWCEDEMNGLNSWQPYHGKDAACNLSVVFGVRGKRLDATLFCRSNDIVWGAYGANAVHFSFLQEYVAAHAGLDVGTLTQVSVDWHGYINTLHGLLKRFQIDEPGYGPFFYGPSPDNPYKRLKVHDMVSTPREVWDNECYAIVTEDGRAPGLRRSDFDEPFFGDVALPMIRSHDAHVDGDREGAIYMAQAVAAPDWRAAAVQWLQRRYEQ